MAGGPGDCRQQDEGGDEQRGSDRAGRAEGLAEDGDAQRGRGEWLEQAHDARDGGGNAPQARREECVGDGGGPEAQVEEEGRGADQIMAGRALEGEGGRQEERGEPEGDGGHGERGRPRQDALGGDRVHRIRQPRPEGEESPGAEAPGDLGEAARAEHEERGADHRHAERCLDHRLDALAEHERGEQRDHERGRADREERRHRHPGECHRAEIADLIGGHREAEERVGGASDGTSGGGPEPRAKSPCRGAP